jgi:hypothetical protein
MGMTKQVLGVALAATVAWTSGLAAQQPGGHSGHGGPRGSDSAAAMMQRHGREMDSLDARLDSLMTRMNRSTGAARVDAMAAAITELVAQRRTMHAHHRDMMHGSGKTDGPGGHPPH